MCIRDRPISLQKRKTEHFTASANDAFAVIRITAKDSTEECCCEVMNYLCELLSQEDFPRSYAVEFKGPEKRYLPITGPVSYTHLDVYKRQAMRNRRVSVTSSP